MPGIEWDDKYLIGIKQFDDDHKFLVGLLGEMYNSFLSSKSGERKPQEILDSLAHYTLDHFGYEEQWMCDFNYPQREQHFLEDNTFKSKLSEFCHNFQEGTVQLTLDIISFLRVWLLSHISRSDFDLGRFQRESGGENCAGSNPVTPSVSAS